MPTLSFLVLGCAHTLSGPFRGLHRTHDLASLTPWSEVNSLSLNASLWVPIPHTVQTSRLHHQNLFLPYFTWSFQQGVGKCDSLGPAALPGAGSITVGQLKVSLRGSPESLLAQSKCQGIPGRLRNFQIIKAVRSHCPSVVGISEGSGTPPHSVLVCLIHRENAVRWIVQMCTDVWLCHTGHPSTNVTQIWEKPEFCHPS